MLTATRFALCIDGEEFKESMDGDIRAAKRSVYVQTLSFEGDSAGTALAEAMTASRAPDRRIWADSVTEYLVNDRFLYLPRSLADGELRREVRATRRMVSELRSEGVQVTMGDPIGLAVYRLLIRNHKKLIVIDDEIAYIGGINFSDHNFAWHDLMLRIQSKEVVQFLRRDFLSTWVGKSFCASATFNDMDLHSVDGRGNKSILTAVAGLIGGARHRIYVQCPYITSPFFEFLGKASRRGIEVTVVISEVHNRGLMKEGMLEACRREGLRAYYYRGRMTHAKALLVDDSALVLGSANFDFSSFGMQPEIVGIFRNPGLIEQFTRRVVEADAGQTREATAGDRGGLRGVTGYGGMRMVEEIFKIVKKLP